MKKYCILFLLLAFCFGFIQQHHLSVIAKRTAVEAEQEYGETSIGSYSTGWYDGCYLQHSPPTEAITLPMTVRYGYIYATTGTGSNHFSIAVYENDGGSLGVQVGGCSDEGTIAQDADPLNAVWNQAAWSSGFPVIQPATQYWLCIWTDASVTAWYGSAGGGDDHSLYDNGTGTCATEPTQAEVFNVDITVSNYAAH